MELGTIQKQIKDMSLKDDEAFRIFLLAWSRHVDKCHSDWTQERIDIEIDKLYKQYKRGKERAKQRG